MNGCECQDHTSPDEALWLEHELGRTFVRVAPIDGSKPIKGYTGFAGSVESEKLGLDLTILTSEDYALEEVQELAMMLGRVIRAFYTRTRLWPLLTEEGGTV
jgi:hypothetical protein